MSKIDLNNYEAFLLDYLEGRLSENDVAELKQFVVLHPELEIDLETELPEVESEMLFYQSKEHLKREFSPTEEELLNYLEGTMSQSQKVQFEKKAEHDPSLAFEINAFKKTKLQHDPELGFDFKQQLHKDEDALVLNNRALQYLEGEFNNKEALAFEQELATNPRLSSELDSYRKTKLVADTAVVFDNKQRLKRAPVVIPLFTTRVVYSAAAAIIFLVFCGFVLNYFFNSPDLTNSNHAVANYAPVTPLPGKTTTKQADIPVKVVAKPRVQLAHQKVNTPSVNTADSVVRVSEMVVAQNNAPADSSEKSNFNSVNTASLALENVSKPLQQTEKESLEKLEYAYLIPFEEDEDEDLAADNKKPTKGGFWGFAIRMAKKANQIGIKSINGSEDENNNYLLSFNAMTIEKK